MVHDHGGGESTLSGSAVEIHIVIGPDLLVTVLLLIGITRTATRTGSNNTPNTDQIPNSESTHFRSNLNHFSDRFMSVPTKEIKPKYTKTENRQKKKKKKNGVIIQLPRNHGVIGHAEFILDLVKIGVTDSTANHFNENIIRAGVSARKKSNPEK